MQPPSADAGGEPIIGPWRSLASSAPCMGVGRRCDPGHRRGLDTIACYGQRVPMRNHVEAALHLFVELSPQFLVRGGEYATSSGLVHGSRSVGTGGDSGVFRVAI